MFQRYINNILCKYLNIFIFAYLNNMLVQLNKSKKNYIKKVKQVLNALNVAKLYFNINKYKFIVIKIKYFKYIIKAKVKIKIDLKKVKAIKK